jgi:hypothetical protein
MKFFSSGFVLDINILSYGFASYLDVFNFITVLIIITIIITYLLFFSFFFFGQFCGFESLVIFSKPFCIIFLVEFALKNVNFQNFPITVLVMDCYLGVAFCHWPNVNWLTQLLFPFKTTFLNF